MGRARFLMVCFVLVGGWQLEFCGLEAADTTSFRHEVMAALARGGCNAGLCHGSPKGKNGFRLSLRGADPAADFTMLTREIFGRRIDRSVPERSLVLLKASGQVKHGGGTVFDQDSADYRILKDWIASGATDDVDRAPHLDKIEITPKRVSIRAPSNEVALRVTAFFDDGSERDVTQLSVFTVNDVTVAQIDNSGRIIRQTKGEVAVLARYLDQLATSRVAFLPESTPESLVYPEPKSYIDRLVFEKLRLLSIPVSSQSSDTEFLRRVFLDTIGVLPSAGEAQSFLADKHPDKRERLVDTLLDRPEFDDFWTLKWLDVLRASRKNLGGGAVHRLQRWIRNAIATRVPIDEMVRRLVVAKGDVNRQPETNFYRVLSTPQVAGETVAQLFLGVRISCAQCHNHPFERWTQDNYHELAAFFAQVEIKGRGPKTGADNRRVKFDRQAVWINPKLPIPKNPRDGRQLSPRVFGTTLDRSGPEDPRVALAEWLTSSSNPFFTRSVVNRVWFHLFGRGIVDPVDDFRDSNPPSNDQLLDALAQDFADHGFDLRQIVRRVLLSATYQLSASMVAGNESDTKYFSHSQPRLLGAEQLLDALCDLTGVPERFGGFPAGTRAAQLPAPESGNDFLAAFGKPKRDIVCECERESDATLAQALEIIRGDSVNKKIRDEENRLGRLIASGATAEDAITELFLAAFSRAPTQPELSGLAQHIEKSGDKRRGAFEDILWALVNSREFLFRR